MNIDILNVKMYFDIKGQLPDSIWLFYNLYAANMLQGDLPWHPQFNFKEKFSHSGLICLTYETEMFIHTSIV